MPPAARISDMHTCPMVNPGPVPHVGGPDISGSPDVIVGYMPQARVGDTLICVPAVDSIAKGSPTVLVNGRMAARIGDSTAHGGVIVAGCPTVLIGESGQGATLKGASADGTPFCEECEKAKKALLEKEKVPPPNAPPPGSAEVITPEGKGIIQSLKRAAAAVLPEAEEDRERLIRAIKPVAQKLLDKGGDDKTVADWARLAKGSIFEAYDLKDHWDVASKILERNKDKFGDELGPKVEWLLSEKGHTARDIIDSAATGKLPEKLSELKPELIDRVAERLIEDEQMRGLVVAAANGNLKDRLLETKDQVIDKVVGDVIENPKVAAVFSAALKGDISQGNLDEAKSLALGAISDQIPNEELKGVVGAIAEGNLPDKLSEMSQGALDKVLDGLIDDKTRQFAKPLIDQLKEMVGAKVSDMAGGVA